MWKQLWNWVTGRGWNSLEGSEDRNMRESLELPRDLLNDFAQNADSDMNDKVQAEVVLNGNEKLVENWSNGDSCLVSFTHHNYFAPHPCCMYQYFIPFLVECYSLIWIYPNLFILFMDIWVVSSLGLLQIKLL